jgi:hypothetical protein
VSNIFHNSVAEGINVFVRFGASSYSCLIAVVSFRVFIVSETSDGKICFQGIVEEDNFWLPKP